MEFFNSALGENVTFVPPAYFMISGFFWLWIPYVTYYCVFLFFVYIISVVGNAVVMAVISLDHNLRIPKFIAVFNLAFVDLLGNSAQVPKIMDIFLFNPRYIPYNDCLAFLFFCYINSYFCDHGQLYRLACNDYTSNFVIANLAIALFLWLPVTFILLSYLYIGYALSIVATVQERVALHFIPVLITFTMSKDIHPNARIINLTVTSILPPMLNPIIYVLQTQEMKVSEKKILKIEKQSKILARKVIIV